MSGGVSKHRSIFRIKFEFHRGSRFGGRRFLSKRANSWPSPPPSLPLSFVSPRDERRFAREQRKEIRLTIYRGEGCAFLIFQSSVVTAARRGRNDGRFASRFKLGSLDASEIPRGPRHATSTDFQFERSRLRASVDLYLCWI